MKSDFYSKLDLPKGVVDALKEQNNILKACRSNGIKDNDKPIAILSFDMDKIKDYVFASAKLPEIRGASELIKEVLEEGGIEQILNDYGLSKANIIYASGGGGVLIMPHDKVQLTGNDIEKTFAKKCPGATVTWDYIEVHPMELRYGYRCLEFDFLKAKEFIASNDDILKYLDCESTSDFTKDKWCRRKCFGELVIVLSSKLQKKKGERHLFPFYETIPFAKRCSSCGMQSVDSVTEYHKDYEHLKNYEGEKDLCRVCWKKKKKGHSVRKYDKHAEDLSVIGSACKTQRAKGYVGVIYADGNGMGSVLQQLEEIDDYRDWSKHVQESIDKTLEELINDFKINDYHEKLVSGGDDIIVFLPADKTFDFAKKLISKIVKKLKEYRKPLPNELREKLGLSAGVVIAHNNYPALYLVEYAEQLLKSAKKHGKKENYQSAIDFAILTESSPLSMDIKTLRERLYKRADEIKKGKSCELNLISRPFTLEEFSTFLKNAKSLKAEVARSQIYLIRESVQNHSKKVAEVNFMYQLAQCEKNKSWQKWIKDTTCNDWSLKNTREIIWKEIKKNEFSTPFIDYTEVYNFI